MESAVTKAAALKDLIAASKECLVAVSAAMRVVADLDADHLMGIDDRTREQRFVDELHVSGVKDGFGVRLKAAIEAVEAKS